MNEEQYKKAKEDLECARWKLKNLIGSDSFSFHMKMHVDLLEDLIGKYEDSYHINKPIIENFETNIEAIK